MSKFSTGRIIYLTILSAGIVFMLAREMRPSNREQASEQTLSDTEVALLICQPLGSEVGARFSKVATLSPSERAFVRVSGEKACLFVDKDGSGTLVSKTADPPILAALDGKREVRFSEQQEGFDIYVENP